MKISLRKTEPAGIYVNAEGKIDIETAIEYGTTIKDNLDDIKELVLDFSQITYISSMGLRVILELHKQMEEQGKMIIKNPKDEIINIFKMTGFDKFLNIE